MTNTVTNNKLNLIDNLAQIDLKAEDTYSLIFEQIQKYISFDAATFYVFNSETKKLEKKKSYNQDVEILTGIQIEYGDGLSGWSADSAQPILITDRTKKKSYNPETDFASFLSVPILRSDTLCGVLNLGSFEKKNFTQNHIDEIETASTVISYIIEYCQLSRTYTEIQTAYINSVDQLNSLNNQLVLNSTVDKISSETSEVIHGINNALSIILGNLQCLLIGKNEFNQKSLSRLKRIETAAKKISESNNKILNLNSMVNLQSDKTSNT